MGFLCIPPMSPFAVTLSLFHSKLTDLEALSKCVHLRFLDVSNNHLNDLSPLTPLAQLLWLKAIIYLYLLLYIYFFYASNVSQHKPVV